MDAQSIEILANKLGVGGKELVGHYAKAAPLEWVDVWVSVGFSVLFLLIVVAVSILGVVKDDGETVGLGFAIIVVFSIIFALAIGYEFTEAYKASHAPERWAISEILNDL